MNTEAKSIPDISSLNVDITVLCLDCLLSALNDANYALGQLVSGITDILQGCMIYDYRP